MKPPPLLVSFPSVDDFLNSLSHLERTQYGSVTTKLVADGLPPAVSVRCIAALFGFSPAFVGAMSIHPERYYRVFTIPKGQGKRQIQAPRVALKVIQTWFGFHLSKEVSLADSVFGFVPGRSAVLAAAVHCGADWVLSLDIQDFFRSTPSKNVSTALQGLGYPKHGADLMARLCSYRGTLAQGSQRAQFCPI